MDTTIKSISGHFDLKKEKENLTQSFANKGNSYSRHGELNRNEEIKTSFHFNFKHFFIGLLGLILVFYFILGEDNNQRVYTTNKGYYGSSSKTDLKNFIRYISNEEQSLALQQINNGNVFEIPSGEDVYLIKSDFGLIKIRLRNESFEFWTVVETIKK